jgi:hypothetical protein
MSADLDRVFPSTGSSTARRHRGVSATLAAMLSPLGTSTCFPGLADDLGQNRSRFETIIRR